MRWLHAALGALTEWPRLGIAVKLCEPAQDLEQLQQQLRSPKLLQEYAVDSELAWARHYDKAPERLFPGWLDSLLASDLVVGFELPPGLKRALHSHGQRYISFHIHALRFLRDLCLGASTNSPALARRLESCAVEAPEVQAQVRRFTAQLRRDALAAFELPPQWPLLIGQTGRDSILIHKGRFADWQHFEQRLAQLLKEYPGCVLLEHPMRDSSIAIAQYLRARFSKPVVMSNANGYGVLFSAHPIPEAVTLASSLGVEAQAAGIKTSFLLGDPRERLQLKDVDVGSPQALGQRVLTPQFWQELFAAPDDVPTRRRDAVMTPFGLGDNYLRRSLEAWSYARLERGLTSTRARKVLLPTEILRVEEERALVSLLRGERPPAQGWSSPRGRAENDHGVDCIVAGRPLSLGESRRIESGDPWAPVMLEGFHAPEHWGVWSACVNARIRIALAPSALAAKARLLVGLSLRIFDGLLPRCPVCRVTQGERTLALLFFRPTAPVVAEIEVEARAQGPWCELDLQLSDIDSPSRTLGHQDERALGIALRSLNVHVVLPDTQDRQGAPTPAIWGLRPEANQPPSLRELRHE